MQLSIRETQPLRDDFKNNSFLPQIIQEIFRQPIAITVCTIIQHALSF